MNKNIKFITSYSGGKDAALALYRAKKLGYKEFYLFTTYNVKAGRSWFHGIPKELLKEVSKSLEIPIKLVETGFGEDYAVDFENALLELKSMGAQACVFGDIDIEEHFDWCDRRCKNVGIESIFPLWNENRKDLVYEAIDLGFKFIITIVDRDRLGEEYLGKVMTRELVDEIEKAGADPCGENGEYHTFVYDGPIFTKKIDLTFGEKFRNGNYSAIEIKM